MLGFKDYMGQQSVPAIVKPSEQSQILQELRSLKQGVAQAFAFIRRMLGGLFTEGSARHVKAEVDYYIIGSFEFTRYMEENHKARPKSMIRGSGFQHSCGEDGCAYFFTNQIVVKFSNDSKEMKIAESVAGLLKRVPIISAFEIEVEETESVTYAVVMRELDTSMQDIESGYHDAFLIFTGVIDRLMELIKNRPEIPVEYIRKRLSMAYMSREEYIDPETVPYLEDLVRAVRAVYIRSGFLLGADWSDRNLGATSRGRLQPFDFGRSYMHQSARDQAVKVERKKLLIPMRRRK